MSHGLRVQALLARARANRPGLIGPAHNRPGSGQPGTRPGFAASGLAPSDALHRMVGEIHEMEMRPRRDKMMRAIVANEPGGPEVLKAEEIARPVPGPGQILMKVSAAGVNFIETYQRGGMYKVPFPLTPGAEAAGTVEAVGDGVVDFSPGDRVATAEASRTY